MPTIKIIKLHCIVNDEVDKDEIFLKYEGKKIWPEHFYKRIDTEETIPIGITFEHANINEPMKIELWDYDYLSPNDHLGTFTMKVDDHQGGPYQTSMVLVEKDSTASYILQWEIV